jgi:hypothetical protein
MRTIPVKLSGYRAILEDGADYLVLGTAGSYGNEKIKITRGVDWEGLDIKLIFHPCEVEIMVPGTNMVDIPWEATAKGLMTSQGRIVFSGSDGDRVINTADIQYKVISTSPTDGTNATDATPPIWEQCIQEVAGYREEALAAVEAVNNFADSAESAVQRAEEARDSAAASAIDANEAKEDAIAAKLEAETA